ncbi:MAG: 1-phosphofructokinase family hexose kinase [Idiomarina sp.]|nr:1-phosphofructokinase family hexose kinase [Idiomarina sp.]
MSSTPVVTFTMNPAIDVFGVTDEIFDDSKSRCDRSSIAPGGGGINVARNLQRMGTKATAVFPIGGVNGELLKKLLDRDHTPYLAVPIQEETRQNFAITERKNKVMHHFVFRGPVLSQQEWQACQQALLNIEPQPSFLVLSGSIPDTVPSSFYNDVVSQVHERGTKVILDTSGKALSETLFCGAYLAKLNRKEFSSLGYNEDDDVETLCQQMVELVERGAVEVLIVTLNRGGAVLVSRDHTDHPGQRVFFAAPQVHIVSHVGAGDSFVSALAHQLNLGTPLIEATRYGVAAASVTVQLEGNQLDDLEWLERMVKEIEVQELK